MLVYFAIRELLRYFFRALWFGFTLMFGAVIAIFQGVPQTTRRIADDWTQRAIQAGVSTQHAPMIWWTVRVVSTLAIFTGWVMLAYFTVFFIGRLLH